MCQGWIKIHRKIMENPVVTKDGDYFRLWMHLLLNAKFKEFKTMLGGRVVELKAGQLVIGIKVLGNELDVSSSKIQRMLNDFEKYGMIERDSTNRGSIVTIINWEMYQGGEDEEVKEVKEEVKKPKKKRTVKEFTPPTKEEVISYCEEKGYIIDVQRFLDYYEALDWKDGNGKKVKNWKQKIVSVWGKKGTEQKPQKPREEGYRPKKIY